MGRTQRVREVARKLQRFTSDEVATALNVRSYDERLKVRVTINDMRKTGEIKNIHKGLYYYDGNGHHGRGTGMIKKIYRAMFVKTVFTCPEITALTDADDSYVRQIVRDLKRKGDIREDGIKKGMSRWPSKIYRVMDGDRFFLEKVRGG